MMNRQVTVNAYLIKGPCQDCTYWEPFYDYTTKGVCRLISTGSEPRTTFAYPEEGGCFVTDCVFSCSEWIAVPPETRPLLGKNGMMRWDESE